MFAKFSAVSKADKSFTIDNFKKYADEHISAVFDCGVSSGKALKKLDIVLPCDVEKIFSFRNDIFVFCKDKFIYKTEEKGCKRLSFTKFEEPTDVFSIGEDKDKIVYVKDGENLYFFGKTIGFICCDKEATVKHIDGRLFCVYEHYIKFNDIPTCPFIVHEKKPEEFFYTDKKFGKIQGVFKTDRGVVVICEKGAYFLELGYNFEQIKVDKILKFNSIVVNGSIIEKEDNILLVIGNKICNLKNNSITEIAELPKEITPAKEKATFKGKYYLLPVIKKDTKRFFVFDLDSHEFQLIKHQDVPCELINDDGKNFYLKSIPLEFGQFKEKVLTTIHVRTETPIKVSVSGDSGVATFVASQTASGLITGIRSRAFVVEMSGEEAPVKVDEIKFYFKD